ncbi:MAG: hypothetical protein KDI51_12205 [Xanthomonadales bacterium]|nr:hypothetical protein [Xanthomonadales bacterium]
MGLPDAALSAAASRRTAARDDATSALTRIDKARLPCNDHLSVHIQKIIASNKPDSSLNEWR